MSLRFRCRHGHPDPRACPDCVAGRTEALEPAAVVPIARREKVVPPPAEGLSGGMLSWGTRPAASLLGAGVVARSGSVEWRIEETAPGEWRTFCAIGDLAVISRMTAATVEWYARAFNRCLTAMGQAAKDARALDRRSEWLHGIGATGLLDAVVARHGANRAEVIAPWPIGRICPARDELWALLTARVRGHGQPEELRGVRSCSFTEVAFVWGCSPSTVASRARRGLALLPEPVRAWAGRYGR